MPHPHPAVITTPTPSSHPERGRISLGNFWSSCGWPEVTQQGTGLDLSSPTAPAPGVLDLGVNWLDTSSFLELWFGQAEGRKGSVALCRCSGPGTIRAGSKERGLLARGHGDPGLRSSCAWPMEEDPSFLGILFCVQDPGYEGLALLEPGCTSKRPGQCWPPHRASASGPLAQIPAGQE